MSQGNNTARLAHLNPAALSSILIQAISSGKTLELDAIKVFLGVEGGTLLLVGGEGIGNVIEITDGGIEITRRTNDLQFVRASMAVRKWKAAGKEVFCRWNQS